MIKSSLFGNIEQKKTLSQRLELYCDWIRKSEQHQMSSQSVLLIIFVDANTWLTADYYKYCNVSFQSVFQNILKQ